MASHQDRKPQVIHGGSVPKKNVIGTVTKNFQPSAGTVFASKIDKEEIKLPTVPKDLAKEIGQARVAKGLTQVQLATKCNVKSDVIRDYENGTAIMNHDVLTKINGILGTHFKKPALVKFPTEPPTTGTTNVIGKK